MTYRQRLTGAGYTGVALVIGSPLLLGVVIGSSPSTPMAALFAASVAVIAGMIMILVGREYYEYAPDDVELEDEADLDAAEEAWQRIENPLYPGQPITRD